MTEECKRCKEPFVDEQPVVMYHYVCDQEHRLDCERKERNALKAEIEKHQVCLMALRFPEHDCKDFPENCLHGVGMKTIDRIFVERMKNG